MHLTPTTSSSTSCRTPTAALATAPVGLVIRSALTRAPRQPFRRFNLSAGAHPTTLDRQHASRPARRCCEHRAASEGGPSRCARSLRTGAAASAPSLLAEQARALAVVPPNRELCRDPRLATQGIAGNGLNGPAREIPGDAARGPAEDDEGVVLAVACPSPGSFSVGADRGNLD